MPCDIFHQIKIFYLYLQKYDIQNIDKVKISSLFCSSKAGERQKEGIMIYHSI